MFCFVYFDFFFVLESYKKITPSLITRNSITSTPPPPFYRKKETTLISKSTIKPRITSILSSLEVFALGKLQRMAWLFLDDLQCLVPYLEYPR